MFTMMYRHLCIFFTVSLCISLARGSNYDSSNCYSSNSQCPTCEAQTSLSNLIGYEVSGCNPLFGIIDLGFGVFPILRISYDWYLGRRAELDFLEPYAYIIDLQGTYYYISVVGNGCPKLEVLTNSPSLIILPTTIKHSVAQFLLQRFLVPYAGNCDVIVPLTTRDFPSSPCPENVPDCPFRNQFSDAVSAYFVTPNMGNNTDSAVNQTIYNAGLRAEITTSSPTGNYLIQLVENIDNEYCEPSGCKRLNTIQNVTEMLINAGYDITKIRPENPNGPCLISQGVAQAFTLPSTLLPFAFTYFVMAVVTPASCVVEIVKFAGPIITDAFRRFLVKLFEFCR